MGIDGWWKKHTRSLAGKTVAITGSTGDLGRQICRHLASLGASLILLDRSRERSEALRDTLLREFPLCSARCVGVDLERIDSVKEAVEALKAYPVDVFLHNAGAYRVPRYRCDTGWNNVFQINFVSPYYMIRSLLPALRARKGRVIVMGSIAYGYSKTDPEDVDFSTRSRPSRVYGNAKRYLMVSLYELFRGEREASLSVVHPGITLTKMTTHFPKPVYLLIKLPMKLLFPSPRRASLVAVAGVFEACGDHEWIGPRYFRIWGLPKRQKLRGVSREESRAIGERAERIFHAL